MCCVAADLISTCTRVVLLVCAVFSTKYSKMIGIVCWEGEAWEEEVQCYKGQFAHSIKLISWEGWDMLVYHSHVNYFRYFCYKMFHLDGMIPSDVIPPCVCFKTKVNSISISTVTASLSI